MVTTSTQGGESANQPKTLSERQRWELLRLAEKAVQDTQDYLTPTAPDSSPASNASRPARLRSPWSLLAGNCRPKTIRSVTRWTKGGMLQNQNLSESISKQKDWDLRTSGTSPVVGSWPTSTPGPEDDEEALLPVALPKCHERFRNTLVMPRGNVLFHIT